MGMNLVRNQRATSKRTIALTAEDYALIKTLWTRIEFEPKVHGTGFYLRFFAKYPQYIKYFLADPGKDNVNPDAQMIVKFTVVMEILGYLILDFHNKPKEFAKLIGYIGIVHKDMDISYEDSSNFFSVLIEYLKDVMSDLMTNSCEAVFVFFFRSIQDLIMKSIEEERQRFEEGSENALVARSHLRNILPCGWFEFSSKLIYGQPREYWVLRQREWKSKMKFWEQDIQSAPAAINLQNTLESTSSEDEAFERAKGQEQRSDPELRNSYPDDENRVDPFLVQRVKYMNTERLVSVPHFEQLVPESLDIATANEIAETSLINDRSSVKIRLTPRERHRAKVAAMKSLRIISSIDTGTPRDSDEYAARERRRSTWR